jgi:hypothetical protein
MMRKIEYSKFKINDPSDAKLKGMYSCEESRNNNQDISMNEKTFVEMHGTHLCVCAIFLVKPDVTSYYSRPRIGISDRTYPHFFPIQPLYVSTPQNSECCEAQSILIVVSHAEKECLVLLCKNERPCWTCKILVWACKPQQVTVVTVNFPKRSTYYTCI